MSISTSSISGPPERASIGLGSARDAVLSSLFLVGHAGCPPLRPELSPLVTPLKVDKILSPFKECGLI